MDGVITMPLAHKIPITKTTASARDLISLGDSRSGRTLGLARGMVMTPSMKTFTTNNGGGDAEEKDQNGGVGDAEEESVQDALKLDVETKTLDSVLFYVLLSLLGCDDALTTTVHPSLLSITQRQTLVGTDSPTTVASATTSVTPSVPVATTATTAAAVPAAKKKAKTLEDEIFGSSSDDDDDDDGATETTTAPIPLAPTPAPISAEERVANMMTVRSDEVLVKLKSYISDVCIPAISNLTTGSDTGLYDVHFGRLIYAHLHSMPVAVFTSLLQHTSDIQAFTSPISQIFLARLSNVDLQMRVTDEISFFRALDRLLWRGKVVFAPAELESLLRSVVLEHGGKFKPGGPAHLFRKIGVSSLCAIVSIPAHRAVLSSVFDSDNDKNNRDQYTKEIRVDKPCPLAETIISAWLGCVSTDDDVEMRSGCVAVFPSIATLPMDQGQADETVYSILGRLDDVNDKIRVDAVRAIGMTYEAIVWARQDSTTGGFSLSILNTLTTTKLDFVVKTLLPHMDDVRERVGLREAVCGVFQLLKSIDEELIMRVVVRDVLSRAVTPVSYTHLTLPTKRIV
eukprot:TRINITY_DN10705_c0_g1_i2.p1 TRINITY_DN10705_c0_g1~~TRINITY_DN10705_c0_g1_i2.p1  ORF type:complete len:569 (-),score=105.15 TRINITY_DN10705_c0_g1_i2:108-1814(-)